MPRKKSLAPKDVPQEEISQPENLTAEPVFKRAEDVYALYTPLYAQKTTITRVVKMDQPFICETMEGPVRGKAGDFLAIGIKDEVYPIDAEVFAASYKLVIPDHK